MDDPSNRQLDPEAPASASAGAPASPAGSHSAPEPAPRRHRVRARTYVLRVMVVAAVAALVLGVGAANGVGPLARVTPPSEVTDPGEMLARSLQTLIDASSVHLDIAVSGHVPGAPLGRSEPTVTLDGTTVVMDVRPQDARSHIWVSSPPFGVDLEAVTLFDTLAVKRAGEPWAQLSMGSLVGNSGVDANPLTMVDRLRAWLAKPGAPVPTATGVACAAPSGSCREVTLTLPASSGETIGRLMPGAGSSVGATTTTLVADLDTMTLRPARVELTTTSEDGSLAVNVVITATGWDAPSVIPDPPTG